MAVVEEFVENVRAMIAAGDLEAAETEIRKKLRRSAKNPTLHFLLACTLAQRDPGQALESLDRSIALDGGSLETRVLQLQLATKLDDHDRLAVVAMDAISGNPESIRLLTLAAKALHKARRYREAAHVWRRVADMTPRDPLPILGALRALVRVNVRWGTLDPASVEDENAGEPISEILGEMVGRLADIDSAAALEFLPRLSSEQVDIASHLLIRARAAGLNDGDAIMIARVLPELRRKADTLFDAGDYVAAGSTCRTMLKLQPDHPWASARLRRCTGTLNMAGNKLVAEGKFAEAAVSFRAAVAIDDRDATSWRHLARSLEHVDSLLAASEAWRRYAEISADELGWIRAAGVARGLPASVEKLEVYTALRPALAKDARFLHQGDLLAAALVRNILPQLDAARLEEGVKINACVQRWDPELKAARLLRMTLRRSLIAAWADAPKVDDAERARWHAEMLAMVDPDNVRALRWLAKYYLDKKEFGPAMSAYKALVRLLPDSPAFRQRVNQCLRAIGETGAT